MRTLHLAITAAIIVASTTVTTGQASAAGLSQAQAAMDQAAKTEKYTFLFFWKEKNPQTDKAWNILQPAAAKMANSADVVSIQTTDPAEKQIVDRYGVDRAPMPLVLAVAPNGAVTKGITKGFDEPQLRAAFVSPCTQRCLKALQSRKLLFVCVVDQAGAQGQATIPKGVQDFKADEKFGPATEIVLISATDKGEAELLKDMQIDANAPKPVAVFLAPPGAMIGKFDGTATKQQIVAKLVAAQSNPCAGGKCGPGGCGPKK